MKNTFVTWARKSAWLFLISAGIGLVTASGAVNAQFTCSDACQIAANYVTTFYPLWFTHNQYQKATLDQLIGPKTVGPLYQSVVAVNVDTLYASSLMDLAAGEAAVLTVPSNVVTVSSSSGTTPATTTVNFSGLVLDEYGNILQSGLKFQTGVYVFVGPNYDPTQNPLPAGATKVSLPVNYATLIFRVDKSAPGTELATQTNAAETFRSTLKLQALSAYNSANPPSSATQIVSELNYVVPFKVLADTELTIAPMDFLSQLMEAVADPRVQPLSSVEASLSEQFNEVYNSGADRADLAEGAIAAHQQIIQNYLEKNRGPNGWINFQNIGAWGSDVLDRASITEFLQFGNDFSHAAYFHTFVDANGCALDGSKASYAIQFAANQLPVASRFWSITAYTPEAIELVPNELQKYDVASYTPGLQYNSDGSLTIYVGTKQPAGTAQANYLPAPSRPFNLMLRVYGPEGQVLAGTYVPPAVIAQ